MKLLVSLLSFWLLFWSSPHAAHAYLDPGAGSVLLQILLGGVAGLLVVIRLWWRNLLAFFGFEPKPEPQETDAENQSTKP